MTHILIIDDDRDLCLLLRDYFLPEHIVCAFAHDGKTGLTALREERPDLVILDVMLPELDGFDVLHSIRAAVQTRDVPVIMLSAKGEDEDKVQGLDLGADDYMPKPFNPRELLSRIRGVLRRCQSLLLKRIGDLEIDEGTMNVMRGGQAIPLSGQEFRALKALLSSPGQVISRDRLSYLVLGHDILPMTRSLDMQISRLRRKLGPNADGSKRIRSVRGEGYMYLLPGRREE